MRFFIPGTPEMTLETLAAGLQAVDSRYHFEALDIPDLGEMHYDAQRLGEIEISRADEEIFSEEIEEFRALVRHAASPARDQVLDVLAATRLMVVVEAVWNPEDPDPILDLIEPLWDWLFEQHGGLLQMDGHGFFNQTDLILEMNVRI
jgi:hypothetical protein